MGTYVDQEDPYDPNSSEADQYYDDGSSPLDAGSPQGSSEGKDSEPTVGPSFSEAQVADMKKNAAEMRGSGNKQYDEVMSQKQASINAVREALRSARDRLSNEHPNRSALWFAVSSAMGAPTNPGGGFGASLAQGAGAAAKYAEQEDIDRQNREAQIDKLNTTLAAMGTGPNAISDSLQQAKMQLANAQLKNAEGLDIAAAKYGPKPGGAVNSAYGKMLQDAGLVPGTPAFNKAMMAHIAGKGAAGDSVPVPGDPSLTGEAYLNTIPASMRGTVKALSEGRQALPNSRIAAKDPHWQAIMAALEQYDPTFDLANAPARTKTYTSFTSGPDAENKTAIGTAIHHLFGLKKAYANLNNTRFPWVNAAYNAVVPAMGGQQTQGAVADVQTDARAVAHELAKVFRKTGMSEAEIKDWQDSITTSATPATSQHVIDSALDLMDGRLYEITEKYNRGMGTTKEPLDMLAPEDRKLYLQLRGEAPEEHTVAPGAGERRPQHGASGSFVESFNSVAEAKAAGKQRGDRVVINGVAGTLQ